MEARGLGNGGQGPASPGLSPFYTLRVWGTPWFRRNRHALSLGDAPSSQSPGPPSLDPRGPSQAFPHLTFPCPVHPSKVSEMEKSQLVNETRWQYYGTTDARGNLSLTWNATALSTRSVSIELWGYEETGEALCRSWSFQELGLAEMGLKRWACREGKSHGGGDPR